VSDGLTTSAPGGALPEGLRHEPLTINGVRVHDYEIDRPSPAADLVRQTDHYRDAYNEAARWKNAESAAHADGTPAIPELSHGPAFATLDPGCDEFACNAAVNGWLIGEKLTAIGDAPNPYSDSGHDDLARRGAKPLDVTTLGATSPERNPDGGTTPHGVTAMKGIFTHERHIGTEDGEPAFDLADPLNRVNRMAGGFRGVTSKEFWKEYNAVADTHYGGDREAFERDLEDRSEAHAVGETARDLMHRQVLDRQLGYGVDPDFTRAVEATMQTGRVIAVGSWREREDVEAER
jgi:hypothetical protein